MNKPLTTLIAGTVLALALAGCAAGTDTATAPSSAPSVEVEPSEDTAAPARPMTASL